MLAIKDKLLEIMPDTVVTVEPHDIGSVSIMVEWRTNQRYGMQRIVSIKEILQRKDGIIEYYVEHFKHLRAQASAGK